MDLTKIKIKIPEVVFTHLQKAFDKFQINTPLRVSHFLAQVAHESGNFKYLAENLNYSADGLRKIFPKYFNSEVIIENYARKPEKIASKVYANRMGNGDEASKDGFKFKGRGYIQLTGKNNYAAFGKSINEDLTLTPDKVATPEYGVLSAAWFWNSNGLNEIADRGATTEIVTKITKKVNGGEIGLNDRLKRFNEYYSLLL